MKLTQVLLLPPKFHYWKEFGAGRRPRMPYFKHWWNSWRYRIHRRKNPDYTLPIEKLPPGSRIMNSEDFMVGNIDDMPDDLIRIKSEKVIYDHPWPFNYSPDETRKRPKTHSYCINSRFYVPRLDCQALTNTLLESPELTAQPPIEPSDEDVQVAQQKYDWATTGDGVLVRLPLKREFPFLNRYAARKYGLTKERQEVNVMLSFQDMAQTIITHMHHRNKDNDQLEQLFSRRSIAYPLCNVPFERQGRSMNLDLCIESLMTGDRPLQLLDSQPEMTKQRELVSLKPRSWKSLLEQTSDYNYAHSFTLPRDSYLHTIQMGSRIKRDHRDPDEMLARLMIHSFGLTTQYARLKAYERQTTNDANKAASVLMQDPLGVAEMNNKEILDEPVVLQSIGFDLALKQFFFMRYQLNTTNFNDENTNGVKNQAWYSGPIGDLREVLRFYLDFQAFGTASSNRQHIDGRQLADGSRAV